MRTAWSQKAKWMPSQAVAAWTVLAKHANYPLDTNEYTEEPNDPIEAARQIGLVAERVDSDGQSLNQLFERAAPCVIEVGDQRFTVLRYEGRKILLLRPDGMEQWVGIKEFNQFLILESHDGVSLSLRDHLQSTFPGQRGHKIFSKIQLDKQIKGDGLKCWRLVPPVTQVGNLWDAFKVVSISRIFKVLTLYALGFLLGIASWFVLGRSVFSGNLEPGWWVAWALMWFTTIPLKHYTYWLEDTIYVDVGAEFRRSWLRSALGLDPHQIAKLGPGQLTTRTIEAEALEKNLIEGTTAVAFGAVEIIILLPLTLYSAGQWPLATIYLLTLFASTTAVAWLYKSEYRRMQARLLDTDHRVEQMQGHRTALVTDPKCGDDEADHWINHYLNCSKKADQRQAWATIVIPSIWVIGGVGVTILGGLNGQSPAAIAGALGLILMGNRSLGSWITGWQRLSLARLAWLQLSALRQGEATGVPKNSDERLIEKYGESIPPDRMNLQKEGSAWAFARGLKFTHLTRPEPLINEQALEIEHGQKVLVYGDSGAGKSTLLSLLAGLQEPQAGMLRLAGTDSRSLSAAGWARRVAMAPQFEKNHVFQASFAFNLLLGRGWPPSVRDLKEAEEVCRELGLGELIDRMPRGLLQPVGETGWQLSHGEKSRMFIARALLQNASATILDESMGTLDPNSSLQVFECIQRRAQTLLVATHD